MSLLRPTRRAVVAAALALPAVARAVPKAAAMPLPLVELRRYRTYPGKRDVLIDLFEREFVESQEAVGMSIVGTFREPRFDDRFTWVRGFADMAARERGLNQFYFGPVWQAHRDEANPCLADNDDVWLLREARPGSGFQPIDPATRPAPGSPPPPGVATATICALAGAADEAAAIAVFEHDVRPAREAAGARVLATFVREKAANNFPRLPVHEDREVFVWFEAFADRAAHDAAPPAPRLGVSQETLILAPTARSLVR